MLDNPVNSKKHTNMLENDLKCSNRLKKHSHSLMH